MFLKLLALLTLIACALGACTSEVFSVLAGFPYLVSSIHQADYCRLNVLESDYNCWCARLNNQQQWAQISSINIEKWTGVLTRGAPIIDQWVTQYRVSYSLNGVDWTFVDNGKLFSGNSDRDTRVRNDFQRPVLARTIRIHPVSWNGHISMRFDAIFERS